MKERPILFNAPMVRALLDGRKTQTRRVIKRQPEPPRAIYTSPGADTKITPSLVRCEKGMGVAWRFEMSKVASDKHSTLAVGLIDHEPVRIVCPYGNPGDRLWVRETWMADPVRDGTWPHMAFDGCKPRDMSLVPEHYRSAAHCMYRADGHSDLSRWTPAIHMYRWASRILLDVTDVRVERLQDISEADAEAEGVDFLRHVPDADETLTAKQLYECLWDSINGAGAWDANPWVWAVSFRPLSPGEHGRAG